MSEINRSNPSVRGIDFVLVSFFHKDVLTLLMAQTESERVSANGRWKEVKKNPLTAVSL